ncbi:polysaccharide deacetylase family protein [Halomonas kalidii]|uniref:Polysaccharide deacetylase family protein n=1 Tax=Halomonas kalidii TaxID=3043293 RepID=A0ABT6VKR6_9GAMM|nr:polysaccharide deacetylase family protein [Halomonas kalidii]MDI5934159.1 polysaccharide deacetylase family protein [Halomonas kalidii]
MSSRITIVMYHYVRPLDATPYPDLKALDLKDFRGQLDYIERHYQVVSMQQVIAAIRGDQDTLPSRPLLLTFDDGYLDHHEHVLPLLSERGFQGSFFPPACSVVDRRVLDVNKIHFVLATVPDTQEIVDFICAAIDDARERYGLESSQDYFARVSGDSRYDDPQTTFVKRVLQRELPEDYRKTLIDDLFRRYVTDDERSFADDLYMDEQQLRHLLETGMYIGSHGCQHYWLNRLSPEHRIAEVDGSLDFLGSLGVDRQEWVMCYPYGGYDDALLELLRKRGCVMGLTTDVALADLARHDPLTLPRFDTNDLPTTPGSVPSPMLKMPIQ